MTSSTFRKNFHNGGAFKWGHVVCPRGRACGDDFFFSVDVDMSKQRGTCVMRYFPFDKDEAEIRTDQIGTLVDLEERKDGFFYHIVHLDGSHGTVPVQCIAKLGPVDGNPDGLPERTVEQRGAEGQHHAPCSPDSAQSDDCIDHSDCSLIPRGFCPTEMSGEGSLPKFRHHCCTTMRKNALNHAEEVARLRHRADRQVKASEHWANHAKARAHTTVQKVNALLLDSKKTELLAKRRQRDADEPGESAVVELRALRREHSETLALFAVCTKQLADARKAGTLGPIQAELSNASVTNAALEEENKRLREELVINPPHPTPPNRLAKLSSAQPTLPPLPLSLRWEVGGFPRGQRAGPPEIHRRQGHLRP